jgi:hypothetical protein
LSFLDSDLVLSLISPDRSSSTYENYEEVFIRWAGENNLRFVSLAPLSFERARFYHIYLNDEKLRRFFIEAPVLRNNSLVVSYENETFYELVRPFFEQLVGEANVVDKKSSFSYPSLYVQFAQKFNVDAYAVSLFQELVGNSRSLSKQEQSVFESIWSDFKQSQPPTTTVASSRLDSKRKKASNEIKNELAR